MPLYDLYCSCGHTKETFLKLNEEEPVCDNCGLQMKKAMSAPAFHLKGKGWFKTDRYGLEKTTKNKENKNGS